MPVAPSKHKQMYNITDSAISRFHFTNRKQPIAELIRNTILSKYMLMLQHDYYIQNNLLYSTIY